MFSAVYIIWWTVLFTHENFKIKYSYSLANAMLVPVDPISS